MSAEDNLSEVLENYGVDYWAGSSMSLPAAILADPGPLLAALAEAGVLTVEEDVDWCQERCMSRDYYGEECGNTCRRPDDHPTPHECVNGHYFPRELGEAIGTRDRRYVTEWRPADD